MTNSPRLLVGFDQFVSLEWADYALSLATTGVAPVQASIEIKAYLAPHITSTTTARKTANVLSRLWFSPHIDLCEARREALDLYPNSSPQERRLLHWGMAIAIAPLFRETCIQIGRLSKLQGSFKRIQIEERVLEQFGNHGTLPRVIHRIIQTMVNWDVVYQVSPRVYAPHEQTEIRDEYLKWLLEVALLATPSHRAPIDDIARLPEAFPFNLNGNARKLAISSSKLSIERDGTNFVYVLRR
jgi:hypothetical protein